MKTMEVPLSFRKRNNNMVTSQVLKLGVIHRTITFQTKIPYKHEH